MEISIERETRRKLLQTYLATLEYGVEQEMRTVKDLVNHLLDSIEAWLSFNVACREIKILEHKVGRGKIDVTISCDGEKYTARWKYRKIIIADFTKIE